MSQLFFCFKGQVEPAVWRLCPLLRLSYQCAPTWAKVPEGPASWASGDGCGWYRGTLGPLGFSLSKYEQPFVLSLSVPPV